MTSEPSATAASPAKRGDMLEAIDNPIERLKLLSGNDEEISRYLDAIEVTSPREREMLHEISRTRPVANLDLFPQAHRNMVEALESLSRHGYHGTGAGRRAGPLRVLIGWGVRLVARYLVVSHVRDVSTRLRNVYALREIQALPGTDERRELSRARRDSERMLEALQTKELGLPVFLVGGLTVPIFASVGRATGLLQSTLWGTVIGVVGVLLALAASWVMLRGAALASRRIRLATRAPLQTLLDDARLVREPSEGPDTHVRPRVRRSHARLLDPRPDPGRDRARDLGLTVTSPA